MKKSAVIINVGRGGIVNEDDLALALNQDIIAGAAIDVFRPEPLSENSNLLKIEDTNKIILTPHIAWASYEARNRGRLEVYKNIEAFFNNEIRNRIDL